MNITHLTQEQIISLVLIIGTVDYLEALDYDRTDWLEWSWINRN